MGPVSCACACVRVCVRAPTDSYCASVFALQESCMCKYCRITALWVLAKLESVLFKQRSQSISHNIKTTSRWSDWLSDQRSGGELWGPGHPGDALWPTKRSPPQARSPSHCSVLLNQIWGLNFGLLKARGLAEVLSHVPVDVPEQSSFHKGTNVIVVWSRVSLKVHFNFQRL